MKFTLRKRILFLVRKETRLEPLDGGPAEYVEFGFDTRLRGAFPRIWKIGTRKMECGCIYRWHKGNKIIICWPHVKEDLGWTDEELEEDNVED